MHDTKFTQNGKISCPTCKKILKLSEQMHADHETVCMFCGTVLYEQTESVSSSENVPESAANLSINLVGDYQKLLPAKMKSNFSSNLLHQFNPSGFVGLDWCSRTCKTTASSTFLTL